MNVKIENIEKLLDRWHRRSLNDPLHSSSLASDVSGEPRAATSPAARLPRDELPQLFSNHSRRCLEDIDATPFAGAVIHDEHERRVCLNIRRKHLQLLEQFVDLGFFAGEERPSGRGLKVFPHFFSSAGVSFSGSMVMEMSEISLPCNGPNSLCSWPRLIPIVAHTVGQEVKMKLSTATRPFIKSE